MTSQHDKPKRWRPQVTIREMFLCTLVAALALGWWIDETRLNSELQETRRTIQRLENILLMHQPEPTDPARLIEYGMAADAWQRQQPFNGQLDDPIYRTFSR